MIGRAVGSILSIALVFLLASSASAQGSTIRQEITPLDCTLTEVSNGSGTTVNTDCPPQPPTIDLIDENNGRPVVYGKYDAVHSQLLRVSLASQWNILGVDNELTANGNRWRLDYSNIASPLAPGSYNIKVETIMNDGSRLSDNVVLNVSQIQPVTPNDIVGFRRSPVIFDPDFAQVQSPDRSSINDRETEPGRQNTIPDAEREENTERSVANASIDLSWSLLMAAVIVVAGWKLIAILSTRHNNRS